MRNDELSIITIEHIKGSKVSVKIEAPTHVKIIVINILVEMQQECALVPPDDQRRRNTALASGTST